MNVESRILLVKEAVTIEYALRYDVGKGVCDAEHQALGRETAPPGACDFVNVARIHCECCEHSIGQGVRNA